MKTIGLLLVMVMAGPAAAAAQESGVKGTWFATVSGGASMPAGGEFHEGGQGFVLGLATRVDSKSYTDIYDPGFAMQAGMGYGVSRNIELFGQFAWKQTGASELLVGNVANLDLRAAFDDYTSYGVDAGMRYHFAPDARVNPYMAVLGGYRRVEAISGTFTVPSAGVTLANTPFFDDTNLAVAGADAGVIVKVLPRVGIGVEAGMRFHGDLTQIEGLTGTGLENLNNAGTRWSVPVSGVLRVSF